MTVFEDQLKAIIDKDDLHRWIDSLPEGTACVVLADKPDGTHEFNYMGDVTKGRALWLTKIFEHSVLLG